MAMNRLKLEITMWLLDLTLATIKFNLSNVNLRNSLHQLRDLSLMDSRKKILTITSQFRITVLTASASSNVIKHLTKFSEKSSKKCGTRIRCSAFTTK